MPLSALISRPKVLGVVLFTCSMILRTHGQVYDIESRKQLFIDRSFVTESRRIELVMNPPCKGGPIMTGTESWERGYLGAYGTVLEDGGKCRMWYMGVPPDSDLLHDTEICFLCYAESTDAVHWTKPNLGLWDWRGSKANNIVLEASLGSAGVLIDPKAPPAERYKLIAVLHQRSEKVGNDDAPEGTGIYIYTSSDGLRWTLHPRRVFPFAPDTLNMAFYDDRTGLYFAYVRTWNPLRRVGVLEMADLLQPWPWKRGAPKRKSIEVGPVNAPSQEVEDAFGTDAGDPPNLDFYTPAVVKYPWADDVYLMFPSAYFHFPEPPVGKYRNDGILDIDLAAGRTGHTFARLSRRPYIGLGTTEEGDSKALYMFVGILRRSDTLYQYYAGYDFTHNDESAFAGTRRRGALFLARQRIDGFVSADAGPSGGSFSTPPLIFRGRHLVLNRDASATGEIRVELEDATGKALDGFASADCDPQSGNETGRIVTWRNGQDDVGRLAGTSIRLAFRMRSAKLYSFQFAP